MDNATPIQLAAAVALMGFLGLLVVGSGTVWFEAIRRLLEGREPLPLRPRPLARWNPLVVGLTVVFVLYQLVLRIAADLLKTEIELTLHNVQATVGISLLIVVLLTALLAYGRRGETLAAYGIDFRRPARQVVSGLMGFAASVLPVLAMLAATYPFRSVETQHPFLKILQQHSELATAFWIITAAAVTAPLAEELVFRVVLQGWLQSRLRPAWAIVITAVAFAAVHGWPDALPLLPLALLLGYVFYQTHSYLAVVVMHAAFNSMNLVIALLSLVLQD